MLYWAIAWHLRLLAALAVLLFGIPTAAEASYQGTPGKVAYLTGEPAWGLKLWDPVTEQSTSLEPITWDPLQHGTVKVHDVTLDVAAPGRPSAPSWSPDGTRFAYSKLVDDLGMVKNLQHTAIFVYTLSTGKSTRVTTPEDAVWDLLPEELPSVGHLVADYSPIWSSDGLTLAFVRDVAVFGDDDKLWAKRGRNLWRTPVTGGGASQVTKFTQESFKQVTGGVWIPKTQDLVVSYFEPGRPPSLARIGIGGGEPQLLTGTFSDLITDFDVSPDGTKLAYNVLSGQGAGAEFVQPLSGPGAGVGVSVGKATGAILRWSGSGDGVLHDACTDRQPVACGLLDRLTDDPGADINPGEPDRLALAWDVPTPGSGGVPDRIAFDIQPQTLPIVFVPGFLGSEITCGPKTLWPDTTGVDALAMRLSIDGLTNEGCPAAGPGKVVESVGPIAVYSGIANFLRSSFPNGRTTLFGWDWRKRPQESTDRLNTAIDQALDAPGPWKDQQAGRVVLAGHSYGGILIRVYLKLHPRKVARVVTMGTPYWGAPKSLFPLAYGIETPENKAGIDNLFFNSDLQRLAANLAGLYQLYPSDRFGPWLTVDGTGLAGGSLSAFILGIGGNTALLGQARNYHANDYEGFFDDGGRIDVRAVVGTGLSTFHGIDLTHLPDGKSRIHLRLGSGDGTVPDRSAAQGPAGTLAPAGDPVHLQYRCFVNHVALPGDAMVLDAYKDFLDFGRTPRRLQKPCAGAGGTLDFDRGRLGAAAARSTPRDAAPVLGLADADDAGLIDLVTLPDQVLAVTSAATPATLRFTLTGGTFTWTPFTGETAGAALVYGPLTGTVEVATAGAGAPAVTVDGQPVGPQVVPPADGPAPPADTPAGDGAAGAPAQAGTVLGAGTGLTGPSPAAAVLPAVPSNRFRVVGKPRLRGRALRLVVELPAPGALRLSATGAHRRAYGSLRTAVRTAGRRTLTLKLKRRAPAKLSLTIAFTPTGGAARTQRLIARRSG